MKQGQSDQDVIIGLQEVWTFDRTNCLIIKRWFII